MSTPRFQVRLAVRLKGLFCALLLLSIPAAGQIPQPAADIPSQKSGPEARPQRFGISPPKQAQRRRLNRARERERRQNRYDIRIMTMGPGDQVFSKFGHNAIVVEDLRRKSVDVFNFGTFSFSDPDLIPKFLQGKLSYWLSVQDYPRTLRYYEQENRSIYEQKLRLTPSQRLELARALELNALPANKHYKYDYYLDNCSTRVRDALDRVLDGAIRRAGQAPGELTYREHSLRLTAHNLPVYFALHYLMGSVIDKPITRWDEAFLPEKLRELLRDVKVEAKRGGELVPLVTDDATLFQADRPPLPDGIPAWLPWFGLVGVALGGTLVLLSRRAHDRKASRFGLTALLVVVGLFGSFWSLGSLFLWLGTDHVVAHRNENLLQLSPLSLLLLGVAVGVARRSSWAPRLFELVGLTLLALSAMGLLLKVLPIDYQNNWQIIGLCLPLWGGLFVAGRSYARARGSVRTQMTPKDLDTAEMPLEKPSSPEGGAPNASAISAETSTAGEATDLGSEATLPSTADEAPRADSDERLPSTGDESAVASAKTDHEALRVSPKPERTMAAGVPAAAERKLPATTIESAGRFPTTPPRAPEPNGKKPE